MAGRRLDRASAGALLVFALLLWFWLIPFHGGSGEQLLLPRLIALAVGGLALLLLVTSWLGGRRPAGEADDPFVELGGGEPLALAALAAVWALYCLALDLFGFYLGGALALPASFLLLGVRRPLAIVAWTLGTLIALYAIFELGFQLRLPRGVIERLLGG